MFAVLGNLQTLMVFSVILTKLLASSFILQEFSDSTQAAKVFKKISQCVYETESSIFEDSLVSPDP